MGRRDRDRKGSFWLGRPQVPTGSRLVPSSYQLLTSVLRSGCADPFRAQVAYAIDLPRRKRDGDRRARRNPASRSLANLSQAGGDTSPAVLRSSTPWTKSPLDSRRPGRYFVPWYTDFWVDSHQPSAAAGECVRRHRRRFAPPRGNEPRRPSIFRGGQGPCATKGWPRA